MSERVRITDVAPRDGLQNEPGSIPVDEKIRLVELLVRSGADEIEVTSFVSPKWVPQLGDAEEVLQGLDHAKKAGQLWSVLTPNERGIERALRVNEHAGFQLVDKIAVFTSASETFSQNNTNASIEESLRRFAPVVKLAAENNLQVRGYLSCAIACPFEGAIAPDAVAGWASRLQDIGIPEIDLGDTIGAATPQSIEALLQMAAPALTDTTTITLHLHDTTGSASACVTRALELGIRSFDASAGGLGGCPYATHNAKRAPGNIATETLVQTIESAGFETGIDHDALREAGAFARTIVHEAAGAVTPTPEPHVRVVIGPSIAEVVLDRPGKRNALTPAMLHDLAAAAPAAGANARCVLLRGEGACFCAGFDLSLCQDDESALKALLQGLSRSVRAFRRIPCPVIVAAHGAAIAGGCALLGSADFVVTDSAAKIGYPVVSLGISPAVSAPTLVPTIGDRAARARLLDPALISGEHAHRIALASHLVESPEDVLPAARSLAASLADKPPRAIQRTKHWLDTIDNSRDDGAFDLALNASLSLVGSPEEQKRLARLWQR